MERVFWAAAIVLLYVYVGYPLVLIGLARWRARPTQQDAQHRPTVSVVIAAYNEEAVIARKIENALALQYPRHLLEITVVSDGSSDATDRIVKAFGEDRVRLLRVEPRGGKTHALNYAVPRTTGEILVLSDANTMFESDAIQKLVRHFADPAVGAVSGDVRLVNGAETHADSEGLYYRYERGIQTLESRVGSIIGADGGMYAIRRRCFRPPADGMILDDFIISMTAARIGFRVIYDPDAVAIERGTLSSREEFRRKVRIIAGAIQALKAGQGLPGHRHLLLAFCYVSHKLLRWLVPFYLVALLLTCASLPWGFPYGHALLAQVGFYGLAALYTLRGLPLRRLPGAQLPFYFSLVNGAALVGVCRGLFLVQSPTWDRTTREIAASHHTTGTSR
jgi:poly-beta-1,6-N-acetyl-D-glucosamine synthase